MPGRLQVFRNQKVTKKKKKPERKRKKKETLNNWTNKTIETNKTIKQQKWENQKTRTQKILLHGHGQTKCTLHQFQTINPTNNNASFQLQVGMQRSNDRLAFFFGQFRSDWWEQKRCKNKQRQRHRIHMQKGECTTKQARAPKQNRCFLYLIWIQCLHGRR